MFRRLRTLALVILALGLVAGSAGPAAQAQGDMCFQETGQCISGRFREYWEQNGGLAVFGFPIAAPQNELNRDTGKTYWTQWFERNRFELHPENQRPYDVLLGRLGDDRLIQQGRSWQSLPKADPGAPHYYAATGHAIAPQFWPYWSSHGLDMGQPGTSESESLALFGLPISEPAMETNSSGDTVLTQWFERARFEYHPANPDPYKVLLGLLGSEVRAAASNPCANIPQSIDADLDPGNCLARGKTLFVYVYRFSPSELVDWSLLTPSGAPHGASQSFQVSAGGAGSFYIATQDLWSDGGVWTLVATGRSSRHTSRAFFRILPEG